MIRHNIIFDMIIRGIVATRGEEGATITEMQNDYFEIVCEKWLLQGVYHRAIIGYLKEIDGLVMLREPNGPCIWYVDDLGNISERLNQQQCDANNNEIINISNLSTCGSVREIFSNSSSNSNSNSELSTAPRVQSELSSSNGLPSTNVSASIIIIDTSDECQEVENSQKRHISFDSSLESFNNDTKRQRNVSFHRLNLIEGNLETHNLHVGSNIICKKTTSTEVECSSSVHEEVNANGVPNGYHSNGANSVNSLFRELNGKCRGSDTSQTTETNSNNSAKSTSSISHWEVCVMGDDLMRLLISYQLFGKDLTHYPNSRYSYCLRGQKIRDAYTTIFDRQNAFRARYKYILLNLGAIDILLGRDIIDIQADFARLMNAIRIIGLKPIITTLPPIRLAADHPNSKEIYQSLLIFNNFLITMYGPNHLIVNLCDVFIKSKRKNPDEYYHNVPHSINANGKLFKIYPWNECGREKILETIDEMTNFEIPKDAAEILRV